MDPAPKPTLKRGIISKDFSSFSILSEEKQYRKQSIQSINQLHKFSFFYVKIMDWSKSMFRIRIQSGQWIRIRTQEGKNEEILCFEVLDVLDEGLEVSTVALTSFMET
jgi:hypothetical protein